MMTNPINVSREDTIDGMSIARRINARPFFHRALMLSGCWSRRMWKRNHAAASQEAPSS